MKKSTFTGHYIYNQIKDKKVKLIEYRMAQANLDPESSPHKLLGVEVTKLENELASLMEREYAVYDIPYRMLEEH